jgi:hypothetical protein
MRRILLLLLALALTIPARPSLASRSRVDAPDPSAPINFNILPGNQQQGRPVTRSFSYTLARGASLHDTLLIVNPSKTTPLTVKLSVSDGLTRPAGGGLSFDDAGRQQRIGRWLRLAVSTVTVPPYHLSYVPLTLSLPPSVLPGEYEGAVNATDVRPEITTAGKMHLRVYMNRRCLVALRVPGHAVAGLRVDHAAVTPGGAHGVLSFTLRNTGTLFAYPTAITVSMGGTSAYTLRAVAGMLLGGDRTQLAYPLARALPAGAYSVRIDVDYRAALSVSAMQQLHAGWSGRLIIPKGVSG